MIRHWEYLVEGTDRTGQQWLVKGEMNAESYLDLPEQVMLKAFETLTKGKAVYGRPGLTCEGPYLITHLDLREITKHDLQWLIGAEQRAKRENN